MRQEDHQDQQTKRVNMLTYSPVLSLILAPLYLPLATLSLLNSPEGTSDKTAEEATFDSDSYSLENSTIILHFFSGTYVHFWNDVPPKH